MKKEERLGLDVLLSPALLTGFSKKYPRNMRSKNFSASLTWLKFSWRMTNYGTAGISEVIPDPLTAHF